MGAGGSGMSAEFIIAAIITVVGLTTPILLAGIGELVVEKSGVLNLGVEGMMLVGAISGFAVTVIVSSNPWLREVAPWVSPLGLLRQSMLAQRLAHGRVLPQRPQALPLPARVSL